MQRHAPQVIQVLAVLAPALLAGVLVASLVDWSVLPSAGGASTDPPGAAPGGSSVPPTSSRSAGATVSSSARDDAVVLVGAGDIAHCDRFEDDLTADLVETLPGIVFTLGDNAYEQGTLQEFEACYGPTWGRPSIKERTRPVIGENEYETAGAAGYFEYFGDAAGDAATGYYAYDAGSWRVYVLNSNCTRIGGCIVDSPQALWLLEDLAANPRRCVLAMWHAPVFSSDLGARSRSMPDIWRILDDAGADLILSGDDHAYERFAPQTLDGLADPAGMTQMVVGTGGAHSAASLAAAQNSLVRVPDVFGVLRLELAPDSYAFEFLTVAGREFTDSGTGTCR